MSEVGKHWGRRLMPATGQRRGSLVAQGGGGEETGGGQVRYSLYRMFARQMSEQPEVLTGTKTRINK